MKSRKDEVISLRKHLFSSWFSKCVNYFCEHYAKANFYHE